MGIIWKYPPEQFSYLRENLYLTTKPRGRIHGWSGSGWPGCKSWVRTLEELREAAKAAKELYEQGRWKYYRECSLLVGYEDLTPKGRQAHRANHDRWCTIYSRRYWWLKSHDRDVWPDGVYKAPNQPSEAVDPSFIVAGGGDKRL